MCEPFKFYCTVKPVLSSHSKRPKICFQDGISLNAGLLEHSAILSTFIKLPFVLVPLFCLFVSGRLRQNSMYFSRNRLTELPSCVGKVKNLKSLHIEYNKISKLCEEMGELIYLEDLVFTCDSNSLNTVAQLVERKTGMGGLLVLDSPVTMLFLKQDTLSTAQYWFNQGRQKNLLT